MEADVAEIMKQATAYVEVTQPQLDKVAADRQRFQKEAADTAAVLVDRGMLAADKKDQFLAKLAEDPASVFSFLRKLAGMVGAPSLGGPSNIVKISGAEADPFVAAFMPEYAGKSGSGLVD